MKRGIKWGQLVLAAVLSPALYAQTPPTLEVLIEQAMLKNHTLANRRLDIESTRIDGQKLKEIYLPTVGLSGKYAFMAGGLHVKAPVNNVPELGIHLPAMDDKFNTHSQLAAGGLKTEMVLYTGGKVPYLKKAVGEKISAQTALMESDRQEIMSRVSEAYDQLALLEQVKIVLEESRKRLQINSETADKALGYGLITGYEHQKIEVTRARLEAQTLQYEGKRQLLIQVLHTYTGIEPAVLETIRHELAPMTADVAGSIENRPEITALNAGIAARRYAEKAAQTWWKPNIQLSAGLGYLNAWDMRLKAKEAFPTGNTMALKTNQLQVFPNVTLGVGFKWDLFDGNKGKREVQQARIEIQKAENEKNEVSEKLELNLVGSRTEYANALAEIRVTEKQRQSAENALHLATKEFKTGLVKASDLVGAETDYQNASLDHLQAVFNQRRKATALLKATGNLTVQALQ